MPSGRNDCGKPGKPDRDLKERISHLKGHYPRMSAAAIFRQLMEDGPLKNGEVSESTVNRHVNSLALEAGNTGDSQSHGGTVIFYIGLSQ